MIVVSNDWINAQKQVVRPEAYVEIIGGGITLTKKNIKNFQYTQSGKMDNSQVPTGEIYFEVFMTNGFPYDLDENAIYELKFGFNINGSPEMINVGYFIIKEKKIPANGLVAKYTLTDQFTFDISGDTPQLIKMDTIYKGGSNCFDGSIGGYDPLYFPVSYPFDSRVLFRLLGGDYTTIPLARLVGGLQQCSYIEAMQQLALAEGDTLVCNYHISNNYRYKVVDLFDKDFNNYTIATNIQYEKPEVEHENKIKSYKINTYQHNNKSNERLTYSATVNANSEVLIEIDPTLVGEPLADALMGNYGGFLRKNYVVLQNNTASSKLVSQEFYNFSYSTKNTTEYVLGEEGDVIDVDIVLEEDSLLTGLLLERTGVLRDLITTSCRIDPRVELFDYIRIQKPNGDYHYGIVEYFKITFNGAFNGEITIRELPFVIPQPLLTNLDIDSHTFNITNISQRNLTLKIYYSSGELEYDIEAGETLLIADTHLDASFNEYDNGNLEYDVYCNFYDSETGLESENTIVLEAQI